MKKQLRQRFRQSTVASAENRDAQGRPLPKPPTLEAPTQRPPRLAWERMLARGRRRASVVSISSLLRFRRLTLPRPEVTAARERVRQFKGLGLAIQAAGVLIWIGLAWAHGLAGAVAGAAIAMICGLAGMARSKPWRCGNCKAPLATAKVRVCPDCRARLVDREPVKVIRRTR